MPANLLPSSTVQMQDAQRLGSHEGVNKEGCAALHAGTQAMQDLESRQSLAVEVPVDCERVVIMKWLMWHVRIGWGTIREEPMRLGNKETR